MGRRKGLEVLDKTLCKGVKKDSKKIVSALIAKVDINVHLLKVRQE